MSKFKFFSHKVLPLVYDESLSYYEVLCKLQQGLIELGDEIDDKLIEFIQDAIPELVSEATYDAETETLSFVLVTGDIDEQTSNEPIKRISINGVSRPLMDEIARNWYKTSWLYNKKLCFYGDSTIFVNESYETIIANSDIPASVDRRGASGTTLTTQGYTLINNATDLGTFDYVFVCYGINDWSGISRKRFTDAVRATASKIITSGSEPIFVFPWVVYIPTLASNGFINNFGCDMAGYVDGAISVCEEMNVKYFNLCSLGNVTPTNFASKLIASGNGYYLHESASLGEYISEIIMNGNYNTGRCKNGSFSGRPFTNWLPTNFTFLGYSAIRTLLTETVFRKGKVISFNSTGTKELKAINSGQTCRITGFANLEEAGAYITIGYINEYDQNHAFTSICRVNDKSDFDFTFTPPNGGGAWRLCFQLSSGTAVISDLTLYSNVGCARVVGSSPNIPSAEVISIENNFTPVLTGYEVYNDNGAQLTAFHVRTNETMTYTDTWVRVGNLSFYPERTMYGNCHQGSTAITVYRIDATGKIDLFVNGTIPANTNLIFDGLDVTPTPFFSIAGA